MSDIQSNMNMGASSFAPTTQEGEVDTQALLEQQASQSQNNPEQEDKAQELAQTFNLDPEAIGQHWLEHGQAPQDVVEKLGTVGVSKEMIEEFISLRYEKFQQENSHFVEEMGGEETLSQMQSWGGGELVNSAN